ncbi:hypothetical protein L596_006426 [Steinernema carpocapsae]|uniref:Uncharacterized protein n=1 Tax=Steinernema carpocapsae TaxID=34508 RepID=A0A4U8V245_STECR|nr:hypothetical protein L596_006426 [Steinernema carpocapsae]
MQIASCSLGAHLKFSNPKSVLRNGFSHVQNPTLDMELSPPVAWTYPDPNSEAFGSFFPGQSLLQSDANIKAMSDIEAAVISALVDSKISTQGVSVRSSYQAPEINDCRKVSMATPKGTNIGIVEANAVVKLLTPAVDITIADCPNRNFYSTPTTPPTVQDFSIRAAVTIQGVTASKYQIRQIARSMMVTLNFRNSVRFISEIKVKN